ncbi:leukocyte cell-derived chemotaxin-2 [Aulostomus maculatus]
MLLRVCLTAILLVFYVLCSCASEHHKRKGGGLQILDKTNDSPTRGMRNYTVNDRIPKAASPWKRVKKTGNKKVSKGPKSDTSCTNLGGICQPHRFICQGQYLRDKCSRAEARQCCMPVGAWSVLCAGHYNNRVRACDVYGCGAFNSRGDNGLHKAVDLVCDDYSTVNAPFSGSLAGPVSRKDPAGIQYDGVKIVNDVHCVKIFNIRPFRYMGPVTQGDSLGYVLPLQERFSGITSHLELQMCDGTDPSPFL